MPLPGTCVDYLSQISDLKMWQRMYENKIFNPGQCITGDDVVKVLQHQRRSGVNFYRQTTLPLSQTHSSRLHQRTTLIREAAKLCPYREKPPPRNQHGHDDAIMTPTISIYPTVNNWREPKAPEMQYVPVQDTRSGKERALLRRPFKKVVMTDETEVKVVKKVRKRSGRGRSANSMRKLDALSLRLAGLSTESVNKSRPPSASLSHSHLMASPDMTERLGDSPSSSMRTPSPFSVDKFRRWSFTTFEDKNPFTPQSYYAQNYPIVMQQIKRRDKQLEDDEDEDMDAFDMYRPIPQTPDISLTMFDHLPRMSSSFSDLCDLGCTDYGVSKAMSDTAIDMHLDDGDVME